MCGCVSLGLYLFLVLLLSFSCLVVFVLLGIVWFILFYYHSLHACFQRRDRNCVDLDAGGGSGEELG